MTFKTFDGITHFHSSLAHSDIEEIFDEIWKHVQQYKPEFDMIFDNITITRSDEETNEWKIHKEFLIN